MLFSPFSSRPKENAIAAHQHGALSGDRHHVNSHLSLNSKSSSKRLLLGASIILLTSFQVDQVVSPLVYSRS